MSLKRSHQQVATSSPMPAVKRAKHEIDGLGIPNASGLVDLGNCFTPAPDASTVGNNQMPYDFADPDFHPTEGSTVYPFFEFLGSGPGTECIPTSAAPVPASSAPLAAPYNIHSSFVGSAVSSTAGSPSATSPIHTIAPTGRSVVPREIQRTDPQPHPHPGTSHLPVSAAPQPHGLGDKTSSANSHSQNQDARSQPDKSEGLIAQHGTPSADHHLMSGVSGGQTSDTTAVEDSENTRRVADRAARNRESSRRAREKAKNRLRNLESENSVLRETNRVQRMQMEQLQYQNQQLQMARGSCGMCSGYGMSGVSSGMPASAPAHPHSYNHGQEQPNPSAVPERH